MRVLSVFGIGKQKILSNCGQTTGTVTQVKKCWWIKINTKPVRKHATDGAVFPHIVTFSYEVNGIPYAGSRYISFRKQCPDIGSRITVYYNQNAPGDYYVTL